MTAGEGVTGGCRTCGFHDGKLGIQHPGAGNAAGHFEDLHGKHSRKPGKEQIVALLFIQTPEKEQIERRAENAAYYRLNQQINKEFYSAYLYLDFSNYFKAQGLDGFANWYMIQAQEERDHAMLFYQYLQNEIFVLYYFKSLSMPEIAKICNVSNQAVSAIISRARKRIFRYMKYYFQ